MKIDEEIKSKFANEHQKALVNLIYTNYQISAKVRENFKPFDITSQQYNILRILRGQNGKPVSIRLIRERMLDKNSDVSRIIDRLLKKEWIKRKESKTDRRQKEIIITEKGLELLSKIDLEENTRQEDILNLTTEEAEHLNFLLDKIRS